MLGPSVAESQHLEEGNHRCRQSSPALPRPSAIRIQHPHACRSRIGMGIHKADAFAQYLLAHDGIRIQKEYILRLALTDGDIVGSGKTQIVVAAHKPYHRICFTGIAALQILQRSIGRMIIHHDDLCHILLSGGR